MGRNTLLRRVSFGAIAGVMAGTALFASQALAAPVTVADNYYGGTNTYNGADVIGTSLFDIQSMTVERIGAGGNTLRFIVNTNYAGAPGTAAADGTGYGSLFISTGKNAWNPTGPAPYSTDVYTPGEWTYALTVPQNPGAATTGAASLYKVSDGAVVMSNVYGDEISAPNPGNNGYYFRAGQAVQFNPGAASSLASGSWTVGLNQLVFDVQDNNLLGNDIAFSWAMTCGNDVIQGAVSMVPEPSTWMVMLMGVGALGAVLRTKRRQQRVAA